MREPEPLDLASPEIAGVERVLVRACGLSLSSGLRRTLRNGLLNAATALELAPEELIRRLLAEDPDSVAALIEHSVVGETYFWRHPEQLRALQQQLFGAEEPLEIWSAGCATGEEPYSIAMALIDAGRPPGKDHIVATDVCQRAIEAARSAVYGAWSLRRLDPGIRARYFRDVPGGAQVVPDARRAVVFRAHNLIRDPPPGGPFDLVLCRNVLIYFEPETAAEVLYRLLAALRPGGILAIGPVELPLAAPLAVEWLDSEGASLLRRPLDDRPDPARARVPRVPARSAAG